MYIVMFIWFKAIEMIERHELWVFIVLLSLVYICLTAIDFIVHNILYDFGLRFSYEWADPYWVALAMSFFVIAGLVTVVYWISDTPKKSTATLLFFTVFGTYVAGLLDVLFWVLFDRSIPSGVLWWSPWHRIFGINWMAQHQLALLCVVTDLLAGGWALRNRR